MCFIFIVVEDLEYILKFYVNYTKIGLLFLLKNV